jgi:hypothetical protein
MTSVQWQRARACASNGQCVEVISGYDSILVRDSENPTTLIHIRKEDWEVFLAAVKDGEFD